MSRLAQAKKSLETPAGKRQVRIYAAGVDFWTYCTVKAPSFYTPDRAYLRDICDQLQEEITRKRYGFGDWKQGNFVRVDSSAILHFDMFANAANVEKLVGSGAFSVNDVLRAANQATINEPWADEHFLTLNIARIQEAAQQMNAQKGDSGNE